MPWRDDMPFTRLPDDDGYASVVGVSDGFWVGRDPKAHEIWMAHCYGTVGVARGNETDSGNGAQLYVVTGHAPRHLDRNRGTDGRAALRLAAGRTCRGGGRSGRRPGVRSRCRAAPSPTSPRRARRPGCTARA